MGLVELLINKFKRFLDSEPESNIIKLNDFKGWLFQKSREIMQREDFNFKFHMQKMKEKRWLLECYIDEWEKKTDDVIILDLFKETRGLLELVTFSEDTDVGYIMKVNVDLDDGLDHLIPKLEKSNFSHDFSYLLREEEKISVTINPLIKELIELKGIEESFERIITQSGLKKIDTINKRLVKLVRIKAKLEEKNFQLKHKKERLELTLEKKELKKSELTQLSDDPRYLKIFNIENNKKELEEKSSKIKNQIISFFIDLHLILEQYESFPSVYSFSDTISNDDLSKYLNCYLNDPYMTFITDKSLDIIDILNNCKTVLFENKFVLEADDAEIVLGRLSKLDFLKKLQVEDLLIKKQIDDLINSITDKDFARKVEEINYKLTHFSGQVDRIGHEISLLDNEIDGFNEIVYREKELLQNLVKVGFDEKMEIIL